VRHHPCPGTTRANRSPVDALCGPHSGYEAADVEHRARESYEQTRGPAPAWGHLAEDTRRRLVDHHARHLLRALTAPPPRDRRPIDHADLSSPPYPDGERELAHWCDHCRDRLVAALLANGLDAPAGDDLARWMERLAGPQLPDRQLRALVDQAVRNLAATTRRLDRARPTGQEELALLIAHHERLAVGLTGSARHEQLRLLAAMRARQRNRSTPHRWRRGGAALLHALRRPDGTTTPWPTPDVGALIAAVDADPRPAVASTVHRRTHGPLESYEDALTRFANAVRRLTGEPLENCESAVTRALQRGLLRATLSGDVVPTEAGQTLYELLLDRVA